MFINCPHCRALIATDPATDLPPPRCPRCAAQLAAEPSPIQRQAPTPGDDLVESARSGVAAAIEDAFGTSRSVDPEALASPAISVAMLLKAPGSADQGAAEDVFGVDAGAAADTATGATAQAASNPPPPTAPDAGLQPGPAAASDDAADAPVATDPPGPAGIAPRRTGKPAPSFVRARRIAADTRSGPRWVMPAVILGLALLLCVQWLLADRARLAADPAWRPVVARACAVLGCSLPPWREPAAFALLERDVRPHPRHANTLRITASFRNDAAWPQPWPEVVLTLSDIDGRPLGTRAFAAAEYLGQAPDGALLESGAGAVIRMDVREPGRGAVAFTFDFR